MSQTVVTPSQGGKYFYTVNRRLLLTTVAVVVVATLVGYFWYQYRIDRTSTALLERADKLAEDGEWSDATSYYQRYLLAEPENTDVLVRLVQAYAKTDASPARLVRLNSLLYRVLGRVPERHDLREMLAVNLLKVGALEEASEEAKKLLAGPPEIARSGRKVIAISQIARVRTDSSIVVSDALAQLLAAAEESPTDVDLVEVSAESLRMYAASFPQDKGDPASRADALMDRLVEAKPNDIAARMARHRYRQRYSLPGANEDLNAALKIDPDHSEALLSSALSKLADTSNDNDIKEVESELRQVIDHTPTDFRAYVALARLLAKQGNVDGAEAVLKGGLAKTDGHFEIAMALGLLQLDSKDFDKADATLKRLRTDSSSYFAQFERETRKVLENRLRLFSARLDLAQGEPADAIAELKSIYLTGENASGQPTAEWVQSAQLLAAHHSRMEEWDQASHYWQNLVSVLPDHAAVVEAAVEAALKAGDVQSAIDHIDRFSRRSGLTAKLRVQLVQAHLLQQLSRPATSRNWTEFQDALEEARSEAPNHSELLFAEVDYLRSSNGDTGTVLALMRRGEDRFADQEVFWRDAAIRYAQLDAEEDKERALAQYKVQARSAADSALLEALLLAMDSKFAEADALLARAAESLPEDVRSNVQRRRLALATQAGDMAKSMELAKELIDKFPKDAKLVLLGAELSLAVGDVKTARQWENRLAAAGAFESQHLKVARLLHEFQSLAPEEVDDLEQTISVVRAERPRWYPIVAFAARYAELRTDIRTAVEDYRLAVELGDRRSSTLQHLVMLLYELNQIDEADKYLTLLSADQSAASFVDSMNMEFAVKRDRPDEAIKLARLNVERYPKDAARRIYLANLLLRFKKADESEAVLQSAMKELPNDPRVSMALVSFFAQSDRIEEARKLLESMSASAENRTDNHALAAQGYEMIGDAAAAAGQYQLALARDTSNNQVRLRYARLLSRRDLRAAQQQYEQILQLDPVNTEAVRELAVLLGSTGIPADWARANQLLGSIAGEVAIDANTNDRLRAILLSQQGRTRTERIKNCQAARKILDQQVATVSGEDANLARLLLAQLLEREASLSQDMDLLSQARDQFLAVLEGGAPSAERLSLYIEFLLRQVSNQQEENADWVATNHSSQTMDRERLLSEAEERLAELRRFHEVGNADDAALDAAFSAQIAKARGEIGQAKEVVEHYIVEHVESAETHDALQRYLAVGRIYTLLGEHGEAEKWYSRIMDVNPKAYVLVVQSLLAQGKRSEAAQLCIDMSPGKLSAEAAKTLANIMTVTDGPVPQDLADAEQALQAALKEHEENMDLLQAEAIRRASRGEYDEAIAAFTRILQLDPENQLALNNLATILAEKPNRRAEALELIQRAIKLGGRLSSLLDTQGTIYLKLNKPDEAIASLEEATAGGVADARYYLHLAAAYHLAQRNEDALRMLEEARAFGLEKFLLTDDDRRLLEELDSSLVADTTSAGVQL